MHKKVVDIIAKYMPHDSAIVIHVRCVTIQCLLINFLKGQITNLKHKMLYVCVLCVECTGEVVNDYREIQARL